MSATETDKSAAERVKVDFTPEEYADRRTALVRVIDLKMLAAMRCEWEAKGSASCDEADRHRGGCCNSCWAARFAQRSLKAVDDE